MNGSASAPPRQIDDAIFIESTSGDVTVTSGGWLRADGLGQPAGVGTSGGGIELMADAGNVSVFGTVSSTGKSPGGDGGEFIASAAGNINLTTRIAVPGGGSGIGGLAFLEADGSISITGDIDASGSVSVDDGIGGDVGSCSIVAPGTIDASATQGGDAGTIDLFGGSIGAGSTARIKSLTCASRGCITFEAPNGGASINAGAVVSPAAVITVSDLPSGCS